MRHKIGLFLGPLLFILILAIKPFPGLSTQATCTAGVALLMATWWITEAIPIPATALLPLILFPVFQIMNARDVAMRYADQNIFLFMGGFFIAMSMQRWELHKRIALYIVRLLGTSPRRIVLGFMCATAFLSMWISNTATAMMMFPIGLAVILHVVSAVGKDNKGVNTTPGNFKFGLSLMLGIAYSASIGGIATLVGTPPNIVFAGVVRSMFPSAIEVGFLDWLKIGLPLVVVFLPVTWFYLTYIAAPPGITKIPGGKEIIRADLAALGKMNKGEKLTLIVFSLVALAWIFRRDIDIGIFAIPGWSDLMGISEYVHDSTVAIFGALLLFLLPVNFKKGIFVLNWEWALRIPWGIILLFGGGFALAAGFQVSGLAQWIGERLSFLCGVPTIIMILCICLLLTFLTELTSNTATTTMMMPVLGSLAAAACIHPFMLMIPAAMSASCAFMLPVATPPNAIVFGSGYLRIPDMARVGFFLNIIGAIIITLIVYFLVIPVFKINTLPLPF
ncbi:MAG: DASS family sodium-coupled anion symporter [candidate division WOR-3 bacterium]|nr:DASS family sodium-coupled anion symporter [candidate division WOR-3 bacterium]